MVGTRTAARRGHCKGDWLSAQPLGGQLAKGQGGPRDLLQQKVP